MSAQPAMAIAPIPMEAVDADLPPHTFQGYSRLIGRAWRRGSEAECNAPLIVPTADLEHLFGVKARQVRHHLALLESFGLLWREGVVTGGYILRFPRVRPAPEAQLAQGAAVGVPHAAVGLPSAAAGLPREAPALAPDPSAFEGASAARLPSPAVGLPHAAVGLPSAAAGLPTSPTKEEEDTYTDPLQVDNLLLLPGDRVSRRRKLAAPPEPRADLSLDEVESLEGAFYAGGVFSHLAPFLAQVCEPREALGWCRFYQKPASRTGLISPVGAALQKRIRSGELAPVAERPPLICEICRRKEGRCTCTSPVWTLPIVEYAERVILVSAEWVCVNCHSLPCACGQRGLAEIPAKSARAGQDLAEAESAGNFPAWPEVVPAPAGQAADVWARTLAQLEQEMTRATFDTWIKQSRGVALVDGTFVVEVESGYAKDWCENRLHGAIKRTLAGVLGEACEVRYEVRAGAAGEEAPK